MFTSWPAAGPALAFFQLLLGPPDAALSGRILFGILDPADELVACQRRDVLPRSERRGVGDQRLAQVPGQLVYHPAGQLFAAHATRLDGDKPRFDAPRGASRRPSATNR